jgi:single-stranded-DNA-specific exonuclease
MNWKILNKVKENRPDDIVRAILENRGLKTKKEISEFLHPKDPVDFTAEDLGIDSRQVKKAIARINKAIQNNERIIVYGDYDADGICSTAILWETLYSFTKNVLPYIPERVTEGYGLNENTLNRLIDKVQNLKLIITVDNGITAADKIKVAKELGIDVIICDHHQLGAVVPECEAIVHTDKICAAAISWFLAKEILKTTNSSLQPDYYLDLAAIATITDLEPLIGVNRSFVKYGLEVLNNTNRCGLLAIMQEAGIQLGTVGTYEIGYIIGPRLNAMGRMESAMESLRLVCTRKDDQAKSLAEKLGLTNKERQVLTEETAKHARELLLAEAKEDLPKLIFVSHESYQEGIIGLAAGRLTEEFYRPAIVVSRGEIHSKASARSVSGFNIIEAIRTQSDLLIDAGGHPMAAGFTVETAKIELLKQKLLEEAERQISQDILQKTQKIDLELPLEAISMELWEALTKLTPFGLGNYEPVFKCAAVVKDFRVVGSTGKHLKLTLAAGGKTYSAIAFGLGYLAEKLVMGKDVEVAFSLTLNVWNGKTNLELKVKDLKIKEESVF